MADNQLTNSADALQTTPTKGSPAERKADQVYLRIRQEIEVGGLKPGQRISENWLVEHTGASRTPVRDALRRLSADELVVLEPRQAPMVSPLSLSLIRDLFAFRRVVEVAALEEIALRSQSDEVIRADFAALQAEFRTLSEQPERGTFTAGFRTAASKFDELVINHCENRFLERSIVGLRPHTTRLRQIAHTDHARLQQSVYEHIDMCEATALGDPRPAGSACSQHLLHVEKSILTSLVTANSPYARQVDLRD
ncbi:GntR family transcriptional regulator [Corynebacterium sp.]|uniref:GntR family transcriptional regulator n=1 Tax=Corynebacterium sp. TaxID=1720 RepID=UPI003B3BAD51